MFNIIIHSLWKTYKYFVESHPLRKTHEIFVSSKQQIVEKLWSKDRCTDSTSALLDISLCFSVLYAHCTISSASHGSLWKRLPFHKHNIQFKNGARSVLWPPERLVSIFFYEKWKTRPNHVFELCSTDVCTRRAIEISVIMRYALTAHWILENPKP